MGKGKRVSNKRGEQPRSARSRRIRIGWRKTKAMSQLEKQYENLTAKPITQEIAAQSKRILKAIKSIIPRKRERKLQARGR